MIRAFLGLAIPPSLHPALMLEQALLPLPRRVDPADLHLTLAFLGDQPEPVLRDLDNALQRLRAPAFDLCLAGLGHFGGDRPRQVYAGVADCPPLMTLEARLSRLAQAQGLCVPHRRFVPHVTLGRFAPPLPDAADRLIRAVAARNLFRAPPFTVGAVTLFRSHLTRNGAHYDALAEYDLTGP